MQKKSISTKKSELSVKASSVKAALAAQLSCQVVNASANYFSKQCQQLLHIDNVHYIYNKHHDYLNSFRCTS